MTTSIWAYFQSLQGRTLHTVARSQALTIESVDANTAEIRVHEGGKVRSIHRQDLEPFWHRLVEHGEVSKKELGTVYKVNSSYAAALLASAPGVTATTNPIVLYYRPARAAR